MIRKKRKLVTDTKEIVQILNYHYVNIIEKCGEEKPTSIAKQSYLTDFSTIVDYLIHHYKDRHGAISVRL